MERNEFKKLVSDPRPLVASLGHNISHILCLKDLHSNEFFIIDTGSDYSIVKSNSFEIRNYPSDQFLIAANSSRISTHGERTMNIKMSKNRSIKWKFVSAEVSHNIIGADFLEGNNLLIDLRNLILVDANTEERFVLINKSLTRENSPLLFVAECKFTRILKQFPDLTRPRNKAIAKKVPVEHRIKVEGYPCHARVRPMSTEKLKWLEEEIQKLLDEDIIEVSDSEYASPIHLVPKAPGSDTKYRIVTDFKNLNKITVKDRYPLPRIESIFEKLGRSTIFSKIDLKRGYWQIKLAEDSRKYTATISPVGLFQFKVLPMGLCNATSTFMRMMDFILRPLKHCASAYIDDIIVYSRSAEEHETHLRQVFESLQKYGLTINPSKTELGQTKLSFLGHEISAEGVAPLPEKVQAIKDYPKPVTIKQLRAFVGLINYYHNCLKNLATVISPLTQFLSKKFKGIRKVPWDKESETAFENVKSLVCQTTLLAYPQAGSKLILQTDASDLATGAALMQVSEEGKLQPLAFHSRKLTDAQKRQAILDRELFAIFDAVRKFSHYLEQQECQIQCDNKALINMFHSSREQLIGRRSRQLAFISEYTNDVVFIGTNDNLAADALSRIEINNLMFLQEKDWDYCDIAKEQRKDEETMHLFNQQKDNSLVIEEFQIPGTDDTMLCDTSTNKVRPLIPQSYRLKVFENFHKLAHSGMETTLKMMQTRVIWPGMRKQVSSWAKSCPECQKGKVWKHNWTPIQKFELPIERFQHVCIDLVGKLPLSEGYQYLFTIVDRYTRFVQAIPLKDASADSVCSAFLHGWVAYMGVPVYLQSDHGSCFMSQKFQALLRMLGIQHLLGSAYKPSTQGLVERVHRQLKDSLRMCEDSHNWYHNLPLTLLTMRNLVKQDLGCSANEMLFGQQLRLPNEFQPVMQTAPNNPLHFVSKLQEHLNSIEPTQTRDVQNKRSYVDRELQNANKVLVRNDGYKPPLAMRYSGPYSVLEKHNKYFVILNSRKVPEAVSIDRLKRFVERHDAENAENLDDDSKRSTTTEDQPSPVRQIISTLNPNAPPWFPRSSRGRPLKPTRRLINEI